MAKDSDKLDIYIKIFNYILNQNKKSFYPKTNDIVNFVDRSLDKEISPRTINRYIKDIAHIFDVAIEKKSIRDGYQIKKESGEDLSDVYKTVKLFEKSNYFKKLIETSSNALRYFSFDAIEFQGLDLLDTIIKAINEKKTLKIKHKRFDRDEISTRKIEPALIKEYAGRWYIIGLDLSVKEFRTFGLDRITEISILDRKVKKMHTEKIKDQFEYTIGLYYSEPQFVTLAFEKKQAEYFKANPWHKYEIIKEDKDGLVIEMFVSINYELEQKILMHHTNVKVIKPKQLIDKIVELHKNAIEQY